MSEQAATRTREKTDGGKEKPPRRLRTFIKTRRDQASIIWGGPKNEKVIARFSRKGVCRTRSAEVAECLIGLGYQEVPAGQTPIPTPMAEPDLRMLQFYEETADELGEILEDVDG